MKMKERSLTSRLMRRFVLFMVVLTIMAIPVLYYITTAYYAEDLTDLVENYGIKNPDIDLEEDTLMGLFIQFMSIIVILFAAVLLVMRYVPQRLWAPFNDTLAKIKGFRVEKGNVPELKKSGTREFDELNATLEMIMSNSVNSYRVQKEFTENASHELQTPLAIVQGKLDNLLQDRLTEHQARELQDIYMEIRHMSRLSRNLLLLSKIENNQYHNFVSINVCEKIEQLLPKLEGIADGLSIDTDFQDTTLTVEANEVLMESMLNNLVVNAVRHNKAGGTIIINVTNGHLSIANPSDEPPLDADRVFSRFYRMKSSQKGNGLGLAIVKSICDYHHWMVSYKYRDGLHIFTVVF